MALKQEKIEGTNITVYDNGGKTLDRYSILFNDNHSLDWVGKKQYECLCASENGCGVYMWGYADRGRHLGKIVPFDTLSTELQNRIKNTIKENV